MESSYFNLILKFEESPTYYVVLMYDYRSCSESENKLYLVRNAYLLNDYFIMKFNLQDIFILKMYKSIIFWIHPIRMTFGIVWWHYILPIKRIS